MNEGRREDDNNDDDGNVNIAGDGNINGNGGADKPRGRRGQRERPVAAS